MGSSTRLRPAPAARPRCSFRSPIPGTVCKGHGQRRHHGQPLCAADDHIPSTISVNENSPLVFSTAKGTGITFTDSFAGSTPETLTLSATDGILTLSTTSGLTFDQSTTNGSSSIVVTGTLAELNAAVNGLTYTPGSNFVGTGFTEGFAPGHRDEPDRQRIEHLFR